MEGFKRAFGASKVERGKKQSTYDAVADPSSRKKGDKATADKATADQSKPPRRTSPWIIPKEASSRVDNTSVERTSAPLRGSVYDSLKGKLEQQQEWKRRQEERQQRERKEIEQNIASLSSGANTYFSSLGEQNYGTGEPSRNTDVSERTIKHRDLILSVDRFQKYLRDESSFIASQVSNVLESQKRDDTQKPLTTLLEECNQIFPTFQEKINSHLETLKGFDQTTYPEKFKNAFATHRKNVEKVKEQVNDQASTINENVKAWKKYTGTLNSLKKDIQRNWSRFNKSIDKLKDSLKELKGQLGESDTYSYVEEQHSSGFASTSRYDTFDPDHSSRYDALDPFTDEGSGSGSWE